MFEKIIITLYCVLLLLYPESLNIFGLTYPKILMLLTFGLVIYNIFIKKRKLGFNKKDFLSFFSIGLIAFSCWVFIVNIINSFITKSFVFGNIFEIMRPLLYVGVIILFRFYSSSEIKNYLKRIFLIVIAINCFIAITQYFNFFEMNELYIRYTAPTQYKTLVGGYSTPRVVGLTSNPNVFGFYLAVCSVYTLYEIIKNNKKNKYILLFLLEYITLFMTSSRTGFVCFLLINVLFLFIYYLKTKGLKHSFKASFLFITVSILALFLLPNSLTWRIKDLFNISELTSWNNRVQSNNESLDYIINGDKEQEPEKEESKPEIKDPEPDKEETTPEIKDPEPEKEETTPEIKDPEPEKEEQKNEQNGEKKNSFANSHAFKMLFGIGSDKNNKYGTELDNEYLIIMFRYGIIGMVIYLFMLILAMSKLPREKDHNFAFYLSIIIGMLVYMYPAGIYHSYKLFMLVCFLMTLYNENKIYEKKDKNVLVIATYFPPSGGVGVFRVTKFVKYLKKKKYNPTIITVDEKYFTNKDESLFEDVKDCKIYALDCCQSKNFEKAFYYSIKENIEKIIIDEKPSVLFITGGPFYALPIARYIYNKYNIPYIVDLRDPWSFQKTKKTLKTTLIKIKNILKEFYTFSKASYILTVNETMTNEYRRIYPIFKNKIITITNGYDEDDFKLIEPKKYKNFTVVYAGKFGVSAGFRDPSVLFEAMQKLKNEKLVIDFVHVGNKEQVVIDLAKKYNVYRNCHFVGFKDYKESLEYCKGADIQILITGFESSEMTTKIFDYMGCNKPIVAVSTKHNELYKICKNNNIFVIEHNEVDKLIDFIKNHSQGEINYNNYFTREKLTDDLIKLIKKVR